MKMLLMIILNLLLFSCAQAEIPKRTTHFIRPGEVSVLKFKTSSDNIKLFCRDKELKLEKIKPWARAIVIESYYSDLKPFQCRLVEKNNVIHEMSFQVNKRIYKEEKLNVDMKTIKLSPVDQARADKEQKMLNQIYGLSKETFLFDSEFILPLKTHITSTYGTRRVYNNHKHGQHLGIDFRANIGDKVPSSNAGRVLFAGDLFYTGYTVIIDHGMDIFSVYGHLSKTLVKEGDQVIRDQLIGLSGNSGRTSGPHLHWGIKIQGEYIDGMNLIEETRKDFNQ
jgi:hypothetical protein